MITRRLGRTGWDVSIIGFGGIPIQRCDAKEVTELLKLAVDQGVNFIDTARGYTVSESLIGEALKSIDRDSVYIATKTMGRTYEEAKKDFEISYSALGVDVIDLYQFHNVSKPEEYETIMGPGGAMEFFKEIQEKGLIKEIGITSHSVDLLSEVIESGEFSTAQFPYNAVEVQGKDMFARCKELDIGTIAMKPIAGGVLMNHGEQSLRYILEDENLTLAIPGMYTEDEVLANSNIGKDLVPLSDAERLDLQNEVDKLGNDFCRRCNYCQPCPSGIAISGMFLFDLYYNKYGLTEWAASRYKDTEPKADRCVKCGICEERCPYDLKIREKMDHVVETFRDVV